MVSGLQQTRIGKKRLQLLCIKSLVRQIRMIFHLHLKHLQEQICPVMQTHFLYQEWKIRLRRWQNSKEKGHPLAYVGDVVGTGSSRKSGINSVAVAHG